MYTQILNSKRIIRIALTLFSSLFFHFQFYTQVELTTDRNTANYNIGETAYFEINSSQSGMASYTFRYDDNTPIISSGTIEVNGGTATIPYQGNEAELVICEVSLNNNTGTAAAMFSSNEVPSYSEEPEDFDLFWTNQVELARTIPLDAQVTFHSSDEDVTNYRLNIATLDNRRMYGYITVPNEGQNFPAVITIPAFGASPNVASPQELVADRGKAIAVSLSIHNSEPDESDPNAYEPNVINDREGYYYRYAMLGVVRIIDYLFTRSDFDGENIILTGVSQGAGLSLTVAGLDNRVKAISLSNPILCRHAGYAEGKASGFPQYLHKSETTNGTPEHFAQTLDASRYYDAVYFARRYSGPTFINVSYLDVITPASPTFSAIKELRNKLIISHATKLGHNHPNEYWSGRFNFWRKTVPSMSNPPYFTSTGYWTEAGTDQSVEVGESLALNGQVFFEDDLMTSFPVKWELVEGPAPAFFNNSNILNPTVSFTTPGNYTLKLTATDTDNIDEDDIYHTSSDFINIEVVDPSNPPTDTNPPSCILNFSGFDMNGNVLISVEFDENILGLEGNDFLIENGQVVEITGSGNSYILTLMPLAAGDLTALLMNGGVIDEAGNTNTSSNLLTVFIEEMDSVPPSSIIEFLEFDASGNAIFTITFSENITGLEPSDFEIENGLVINLEGSGTEYTLTIEPQDTDVYLTVLLPSGSVEDAAGNENTASNTATIYIEYVDEIPPSSNIEFLEFDASNNAIFTITFSENITGLEASDFEIENGLVINLEGSGAEYTLTIEPQDTDVYLTVLLPSGSVEDAAGNENTASNTATIYIEYVDEIAPSSIIEFLEFDASGNAIFTITFSENITGLEASDFEIENGLVINLEGSGAEYTLTVAPQGTDVDLTVLLPSGSVEDAAGNENMTSNTATIYIEYVDEIAPSSSIEFLEFDASGNAIFIITFSENITGLEASDFEIENGLVINLEGSGAEYTLTVAPQGTDVDLTVLLPSGSVEDAAGNENMTSNTATIYIEYVDEIAPSSSIEFLEFDASGNAIFIITFSENITGLEVSDFEIENGLVINLEGSGAEYILTVVPQNTDVDLTVLLPSGSVEDAAGNENMTSNTATIYIEISSNNNIVFNELKVFPNPATNFLYLNLQKYKGDKAELKIFNNLGQLLIKKKIENIAEESSKVDLEKLLNGIYFIEVRINEDPIIFINTFAIQK